MIYIATKNRPLILLLIILILSLGCRPSAASEDWSRDPKAFVQHFADIGISQILESDNPKTEKTEQFRQLFVEAFDIPAIGRFVLGRYWRQTKEDQRTLFLGFFEDMIVYTWSRRFGQYDGQTLRLETNVPDGKNGALVTSSIIDKAGETFTISWRLRQRYQSLKIVDVIIEGVSMAITYRQEYSSVIRRENGIDGLIDELSSQVTRLKETAAATN